MRALIALARGSLVARPLRSILTIVGIALGVGVLVAALVLNAGLDAAAEQSAHDQLGRADLRVAAFLESGLSPASVTAMTTTPGVAVVAPELDQRTYPAPNPLAGSGLPVPVTVVGVDPEPDAALHDRPLAGGSPLPADGGNVALVSDGLARANGLVVGGTITLNGSAESGPRTFRVSGILAPVPDDPDPAGRSIVVPLQAAQALFSTDAVDLVDLGLGDVQRLGDLAQHTSRIAGTTRGNHHALHRLLVGARHQRLAQQGLAAALGAGDHQQQLAVAGQVVQLPEHRLALGGEEFEARHPGSERVVT